MVNGMPANKKARLHMTNRSRANLILKAKEEILRNGKFKNWVEYVDPATNVKTYFACDGDELISTAGRPEGYDTDDDVFDESFLMDLNHRPFMEFWQTVNGQKKEKRKHSRVCNMFLFVTLLICFRWFLCLGDPSPLKHCVIC